MQLFISYLHILKIISCSLSLPCVFPKHTYKTATQQQYPLSTENYSDSETVMPTWQPDVWVHFGLVYKQN